MDEQCRVRGTSRLAGFLQTSEHELGIHVALRISLVSLGGCHHLDGWSSGGGLARVGDCSWPPSVIVRGVVPSPAECRKVTTGT